MEIKIGWLYPQLMSTYGDRGNVICLQRRCEWRGIKVDVIPLEQNTEITRFQEIDLLVGGGAQDRQQEIVMRDLRGEKAEVLRAKIESDTPGVFTCGAPQLLGKYYEPALGQKIEGLGILDLVSKHPGKYCSRLIGNLVFEITASPLAQELREILGEVPVAIGFENHGGRTYLNQVQALGTVIAGYGNNGEDALEGAFYRKAIATYAHGPLLPKNPFIADWLIQTALRQKYRREIFLTKLNDSLAQQAREAMFRRLDLTSRLNNP